MPDHGTTSVESHPMTIDELIASARGGSVRAVGKLLSLVESDRRDEVLAVLEPASPRVIGVTFMGDLWHHDITEDQVRSVYSVMARTPQHLYVDLTKRGKRRQDVLQVWEAVGCAVPILVSAFVILYLYNGRRAARGRTFYKWFFYAFYPAHLLVLGLLRLAV